MTEPAHATQDPAHVAEQTGTLLHAEVSERPLEPLLAEAKTQVGTQAMGAVVTFEGVVRDHDGGQLVDALTYTAHPDASAVMRTVAASVVEQHREVRAWTMHRVGPLRIGELAFVVVVAAAHRGPAFAAASEIADRVKAEVPIWKEQDMSDGSTVWVGL